MILIITEDKDTTTQLVAEWLHHAGEEFFRINHGDIINTVLIDEENIIFKVKGEEININDIKSFWYRKGDIDYNKLKGVEAMDAKMQQHLIQEWLDLREYLFYKLQQKNGISNAPKNINKLIVLEKAKKHRLLIPPFFISDFKRPLFENTVMKAISEVLSMDTPGFHSATYTELINQIDYDAFFATFFQQKITAKYEIRSIFIKGQYWSMAIHNPDNEVDYRKNYQQLRYSPYKLPDEIESNMLSLMNELNLDYGAIDFIVDKDDNHYFLEINPVGQFGMVSQPCNYFIEREIANILCN